MQATNDERFDNQGSGLVGNHYETQVGPNDWTAGAVFSDQNSAPGTASVFMKMAFWNLCDEFARRAVLERAIKALLSSTSEAPSSVEYPPEKMIQSISRLQSQFPFLTEVFPKKEHAVECQAALIALMKRVLERINDNSSRLGGSTYDLALVETVSSPGGAVNDIGFRIYRSKPGRTYSDGPDEYETLIQSGVTTEEYINSQGAAIFRAKAGA